MRGNWFLPQFPNIKLPGELFIDTLNNNFKLEIYSNIHFDGKQIIHNEINKIEPSQVILGEINHISRKISLIDFSNVFYTENQIGTGLYKIVIDIQIIIEKIHLTDINNKIFDNLYLRYNLPNSFYSNTIVYNYINQEGVLLINKLNDRIFELDDYKISICNKNKLSTDLYNYSNSETKFFVKIETKQSISINEQLEIHSKLEQLLFLLSGKELQILECYYLKDIRIECNVYIKNHLKQIQFESITSDKTNINLWNFSDVELENIFKKWFSIYDDFESCISLFNYTIKPIWKNGNRSLYFSEYTNIILNIVQVIEAFYKKDNEITYTNYLNDFNPQKTKVIDCLKKLKNNSVITIEDFNFIHDSLKPSKKGDKNEKSEIKLVTILKHYLNQNKEVISFYIDESDFTTASEKLKNISNSLSHINHKSERDLEGQFKIHDLFNLSQYLFLSILFSKIGMEQNKIKRILENVKRFGI